MSENVYYFRCNGEEKMLVIKDDEVNDAFKKIQQENQKLNKVIDEMAYNISRLFKDINTQNELGIKIEIMENEFLDLIRNLSKRSTRSYGEYLGLIINVLQTIDDDILCRSVQISRAMKGE